MAYKVLIPCDIAAAGKDYLRNKGYEIIMRTSNSIEDMCREIVDCDAIIAWHSKYTAAVLEAGPKLKVLSKHGVGLDNIDLKRATELGIEVTYGPCSNTNSVAEHTIAMLLALATDMVHMDHETRKGNWWSRDTTKAMEISGKVLGIVGMGRIGRLIAAKAALGLEMKVIGYDAYLPREAVPKEIEQVHSLEEVFEHSDFVSLHMPLTPET